MNAGPLRVFVVDDHPLVREGLIAVLELERRFMVVGQASDARTALRELAVLSVDVALVDLTLPDMGGLELIKHIRSQWPEVRVLVVSMLDDEIYAWRALKAGATGFLRKSSSPKELRTAVEEAARGEVVLRTHLAHRLLRDAAQGKPAGEPTSTLSDRELEVFELIGRGLSSRRIAEDLLLSAKTVESHKASIKAKLALSDGTELVRAAVLWVHREGP
jgi:DNA-binding NarL/FixJ family response regulator